MCGIAGYWGRHGSTDSSIAAHMAEQIRHRGPDDCGVWVGSSDGLALAHRRLSVIDLSCAGHQPLQSPCGRFVLSYNGEIYNHQDLRLELENEGGHFNWQGYADTETLLAALRHWGVKGALQRLNGMFAFALWDKEEKKLYLARDRIGEKPLYYGHLGDTFVFGSELKSLRAHPNWNPEIDRNALTSYLRHGYVSAPNSIYKRIKKLIPAHYLVVSDSGARVSEPVCYWSLDKVVQNEQRYKETQSEECLDELESLLSDSVKRRMISDVSLGAFLSGGIDSSLIVALMQAQSSQAVKTFSIGFREPGYNEAPHAKVVAQHLGTSHTELYVTTQDALDVIPKIPIIWDEPFADSSQIPTYMVSQLARQHVTVGLSGDGGDELFCGYSRYLQGYEMWRKIKALPKPLSLILGWLLNGASNKNLEKYIQRLPIRYRIPNFGDKLRKLSEVARHNTPEALYHALLSQCANPEDIVIGGRESNSQLANQKDLPALRDFREHMMYMDTMNYLPDDILTKVDRSSMSVSLEARVPMLDHRVVEYAWKLPLSLKCRGGQGKWFLRQLLYRYVPAKYVDRPKMGFGVPIGDWLRGSLREWGEELLDQNKLAEQGYFNPEPVIQYWKEHQSGQQNHQYKLWNILMFQAWLSDNNAR